MSRTAKLNIPPALRWRVWERDNFTCHYCGARQRLSLDHVIPESQGGATNDSNLVTACRPCNTLKGTKSYEAFKAELADPIGSIVIGLFEINEHGRRCRYENRLNQLTVHEACSHLERQYRKLRRDQRTAITHRDYLVMRHGRDELQKRLPFDLPPESMEAHP